jgi:hypothetical protein
MGRICSRHREMRNVYRDLVGKPEVKRPLGRFRHKLEDNIKMDLTEIRWGVMDWIHLVEDRDQWRGFVKKALKSCVR